MLLLNEIDIGNRINELMKKNGISITQLAEIFQKTNRHVYNILSRKDVDTSVLRALEVHFGWTLDIILDKGKTNDIVKKYEVFSDNPLAAEMRQRIDDQRDVIKNLQKQNEFLQKHIDNLQKQILESIEGQNANTAPRNTGT